MPCRTLSARRVGPRLLCVGLLIILAAQLWPAVPLAGAIAICAWSTAFCVGRQQMPLVLATYVPLAGLAIAAQLHPAAAVDGQLASIDAVASMLLVVLLTRYGFARLMA